MKLIKPYFEILPLYSVIYKEGEDKSMQTGLLNGIYNNIERAGRTCYKSEDRITPNSAKEFVERMIKSGHGAMLEHGTVYLALPKDYLSINGYGNYPYKRPYSRLTCDDISNNFVTTNYRFIVENNFTSDLQYICEPGNSHRRRYSVKFVCDRGVSHEFVRHRVFSFAQESTRYCNYSKDKFGNELTFIKPCWINKDIPDFEDIGELYKYISENEDWIKSPEELFVGGLLSAENDYLGLLELGWQPQQARSILPNALKTELVMTGFAEDWKHFFKLRDAFSAHPQARELAQPLHEEFKRLGYV